MVCTDSSVALLNACGFSVVKLPSDRLRVFDVYYGSRRGLQPLGRLDSLLRGSPPLPKVPGAKAAAELSRLQTDELSGKIAVPMLDRILKGMGASADAGLDADMAGSLRIRYGEPTISEIDHLEIVRCLAQHPVSEDYLNARGLIGSGKLVVVVATLQSDSIEVSQSLEEGVDLAAKAALQADTLAKAGITVMSERKGAVSYRGKKRLRFGFKALELAETVGADGAVHLEARAARQNMMMRSLQASGASPAAPRMFCARSTLVPLGDDDWGEPVDVAPQNLYTTLPDGSYRPHVLTAADFHYGISQRVIDQIGERRKWSVLVVMGAGSSLAADLWNNLLDIKAAVRDNPDIHVSVFFDGPFLTDTFLLHLNEGTSLTEDLLLRYIELDITKPEILETILTYHAQMFPADHSLLVLSGHGNGWGGVLSDTVGFRSPEVQNALRVPPDFEERMQELQTCVRDATALIRKLTSERRTPEELEESAHLRWDILAMDACSMGTMEALLRWYPVCDRLVASELPEPAAGYPYGAILEELQKNPDLQPDELARLIARKAHERLAAVWPGPPDDITQIALKLEGLGAVLRAFDEWVVDLMTRLADGRFGPVGEIFDGMPGIDGYVDFRLLLEQLSQRLAGDSAALARSLLDALDAEGFILSAHASEAPMRPKGLSIYLPHPEEFSLQYLRRNGHMSDYFFRWAGVIAAWYMTMPEFAGGGHPLLEAIWREMDLARATPGMGNLPQSS